MERAVIQQRRVRLWAYSRVILLPSQSTGTRERVKKGAYDAISVHGRVTNYGPWNAQVNSSVRWSRDPDATRSSTWVVCSNTRRGHQHGKRLDGRWMHQIHRATNHPGIQTWDFRTLRVYEKLWMDLAAPGISQGRVARGMSTPDSLNFDTCRHPPMTGLQSLSVCNLGRIRMYWMYFLWNCWVAVWHLARQGGKTPLVCQHPQHAESTRLPRKIRSPRHATVGLDRGWIAGSFEYPRTLPSKGRVVTERPFKEIPSLPIADGSHPAFAGVNSRRGPVPRENSPKIAFARSMTSGKPIRSSR